MQWFGWNTAGRPDRRVHGANPVADGECATSCLSPIIIAPWRIIVLDQYAAAADDYAAALRVKSGDAEAWAGHGLAEFHLGRYPMR